MRVAWKAALIVSSVLLGGAPESVSEAGVYRPALSGPDRLLTNEFAHANPADARAIRSSDWEVTSGSLFLHDGAGWTGPPDALSPLASSANGTGSSVFRATTKRRDFRDTVVTFQVRNMRLTAQGRAPAADTDGIHLFLRWQSPEDLYVLSLNRRDDQLVIKRKSPGGDVNGGTYHTLGRARHPVPYGKWQLFRVSVVDVGRDAVEISVAAHGKTLLRVLDEGAGGPAIRSAGAVGIRGDNCEFKFADFRIREVPPLDR